MSILRRPRHADGALIGIADAFLTLAILGVAAFVLWRGSLAPIHVAEETLWEVETAQIGALSASLVRVTVDTTAIDTASGSTIHRQKSVGHLLVEMHRHVYPATARCADGDAACIAKAGRSSCPNAEDATIACDVSKMAASVLADADALSSNSWTIRIEIQDPARPSDRLCIRHANVLGPDGPAIARKAPCEESTRRMLAQEAFLPQYGTAAGALKFHLTAFRGVGQ